MKCSQTTCTEVASYTYVHPGQEARSWACAEHAIRAKQIADAAGYALGDLRVCTMEEICREEVPAHVSKAPAPPACTDHPPHAELVSIWCRACGIFKIDGAYLDNRGRESVVAILAAAGAKVEGGNKA